MDTLRIGLIGAGANTRLRHIPGFQKQPNVELIAVANRHLASAQDVCNAFSIPRAETHWQAIVNDPAIDAICIGTWPYLHETITTAALKAGKHVLCEARMAGNLDEALSMFSTAQQYPEQVAQLVPAPFTLKLDEQILQLLANDILGKILSIEIRSESPADDETPVWRQQSRFSGRNTLALGIWYETLLRWIGPAKNVCAQTRLLTPYRNTSNGPQLLDIPDHVELFGEWLNGATYYMRFSSATAHPCNEARLLGTNGELRWCNAQCTLHLKGQNQPTCIMPEGQDWHVEADFVRSIREHHPVSRTSFHDGVRYMAFTEAALTSAARNDRQAIAVY